MSASDSTTGLANALLWNINLCLYFLLPFPVRVGLVAVFGHWSLQHLAEVSGP